METKSQIRQVLKELKELRDQVYALEEQIKRQPNNDQNSEFLTEHPHVVRVQGVKGGEPIIRGKNVTVQTIVVLAKQNVSPEKIVEDYDGVLTLAEIYDALSYYHDHPGEIDQYVAENRAALE